MKKTFFSMFLGIFMSGLLAVSAPASHYENARFGYSVDVPESFTPQPEAENGDGRVFISSSPQGEIAVWGQYNVLEQTLAEAADFAAGERSIAYRRLNKKQNWFVLSWFDDEGKIIYLRQQLSGDTIYALQFTYPKSEQKAFDTIIRDTAASFKTPAAN